jgi:hypothetical protein
MRNRYQITTFDESGEPEYGYWVDLGDELELSCKGRSKIILKREPPQETYTAHAAQRTIFPSVDLEDACLDALADFVRMRSREIRPPGLDIVMIPPEIGQRTVPELRLRDVSVATFMKYVAEMTSTDLTFESDVIVLRDKHRSEQDGSSNGG